ncbi:MAG: hypothetical protein ACRDYD_11690 [Acidimicrobiales bacterium]
MTIPTRPAAPPARRAGIMPAVAVGAAALLTGLTTGLLWPVSPASASAQGSSTQAAVTYPPPPPATPDGAAPPPRGVVFAPADPGDLLPIVEEGARSAQAAVRETGRELAASKAAVITDETRAGATRAALETARSSLALDERARQSDRGILGRVAAVAFMASGSPLPSAGPRDGSITLAQRVEEAAVREDTALGLAGALQQEEGALAAASSRRATEATRLDSLEAGLPRQVAQLAAETSRGGDLRSLLGSDGAAASRAGALLGLVELAAPDPATGIPRVVLQAYRASARWLAGARPTCHLSWADLAALGQIESAQATAQDARLAANGDTYPPILGPPLDGTHGNARLANPLGAVHDVGTVHDGGGRFERAVGPMQILPTTWSSVAPDLPPGTPDDPSNVFSAALGAGDYLCRAAGPTGLTDLPALEAAYASYDHSASYVTEAVANAIAYGAVVTPQPGTGAATP